MQILDFINNNGVLFSGIFAMIVALISAIVALVIEGKKSRLDTVRTLRKELEKAREEINSIEKELNIVRSFEEMEKNIDKAHGSIYYEKLLNGEERTICGFCWEKEHIKFLSL